MQITITLGDPLWRAIGSRRLTLNFSEPHISLAEALQHLVERYPQVSDELNPDRNRAPHAIPYNLFVNHRKTPWDRIDQTILKDGDRLALFLLVVGG
jgi:molybdopterin converting factor small subunit